MVFCLKTVLFQLLVTRKTQDPAADAAIGLSVACIGDANGDGVDDLAFNSHTMGRVWVIYGGKIW